MFAAHFANICRTFCKILPHLYAASADQILAQLSEFRRFEKLFVLPGDSTFKKIDYALFKA